MSDELIRRNEKKTLFVVLLTTVTMFVQIIAGQFARLAAQYYNYKVKRLRENLLPANDLDVRIYLKPHVTSLGLISTFSSISESRL
ncbi:MAG: hypothetical protein COV44_04030 [Deltaproteobacteria bacterium CG11_big_fil_rev_8_21_14_0_20_45_16]|nr:MAG: hypothetical protein COV44_04030 [Deltaproteobacteria bacterium CG11_big_fil_rev_8_21_14_0_20_45_16]